MPSAAGQPSIVRGKQIKIAVTISAFALAGFLFAIGTRSPGPVDAAEPHRVDLLCTLCNQHFSVGFEEFAAAAGAVQDVGRKTAAGMGRDRSIRERGVVMSCALCGQAGGKPAVRCLRHDLYYLKYTAKGANVRCPKCSPPPGAAS